MNPQEIFERYVWAGAMTRDADAVAEMFAPDGVFEAPLVPAGSGFPRRLEGRDQIREGMAAYYRRVGKVDRPVDVDGSRYVLHVTADPDLFIVEIDTAFVGGGPDTVASLVQIFRVREGKIALLRDYFAPEVVH